MLLHSSKEQTLIHHTLPTTGRELPSGSTVTPQPAAGLGSWFLPQVHMGAAEAMHNLQPGPTQRQNKKQSGEQRAKLPIQPNHGKGTQPQHTPPRPGTATETQPAQSLPSTAPYLASGTHCAATIRDRVTIPLLEDVFTSHKLL